MNRAAPAREAPLNEQPLEPDQPSAEQLGGLGELRALLLSNEREQIAQLETLMLSHTGRTVAVSDVLLEAMVERAGRDPQFARALRPLVEEALRLSIKRTPLTLADILFPILGPAIRRTVAHSLAAASASLSRTIDQTLTLQAIGWRLEAARTGRSFGEIVLLRTLEYRVEQAYLIHRESGLVLLHEGLIGANAPEAGLVSAMLTAIRDFAQDSFNTKENLDQFQLGELTVHVETGPLAVLAVVVRGSPPQELRDRLAHFLEAIHQRQGDALREFNGDPHPFELDREDLTALLVAAYRGARAPKPIRQHRRHVPEWVVALSAAIVVASAVAMLVAGAAERSRWDAFIVALRGTPGVVLTSVSHQGGLWTLEGLRDPLGVSVNALLKERGLPVKSVRSNLRPFASLEPAFVLQRAQRALAPPSTVRLQLSSDGVLLFHGSASDTWITKAKVVTGAITGVTGFNLDAMRSNRGTEGVRSR